MKLDASDFELGAVLGRGSFSEVRAATRRSTGEPVAIKVMAKKAVFKNSQANNVLRERRILNACDHRSDLWSVAVGFHSTFVNLWVVRARASRYVHPHSFPVHGTNHPCPGLLCRC